MHGKDRGKLTLRKPKPQEIYRHFKGRLYQVVTLCKHSETGEEMVVYQAMYGDFSIYCRPLYMFTETLDTIRYPDADQPYRFQLMKPISASLRQPPDKPDIPEVLKKQTTDRLNRHPSAERYEEEMYDEEEIELFPHTEPNGTKEPSVMGKTIEEEARELGMDERVVAFLDADSPEKRLAILDDLHRDITDDQIDICAMAVDAKIPAGEIYERDGALRDVLLTRQRFESNRLRS